MQSAGRTRVTTMGYEEEGGETGVHGSEWIFDESLAGLRRAYGESLAGLSIDQAVVGVFVTGVRLSNGFGGVAFTSPEIVRQAGQRILGRQATAIRGMTAMDAVLGTDMGPFTPILRLATLNALSAPLLIERSPDGGDDERTVFQPLVRGRRVCMVGAMIPLLKRLRELGWAEMLVADRKQETLAEVEPGCTVIALERLPEALASCQTAILTGATIPNGSLSDLLDAMAPDTAVAVVGPTAGFVPDPLFGRNVALVGTTVVTDADRTLDILAEGGGMYHLFDGCLRKVTLPNIERMRQLGLLPPVAPQEG